MTTSIFTPTNETVATAHVSCAPKKSLDRSAIFKNAWKLVKECGLKLSAALKRAYGYAKGIIMLYPNFAQSIQVYKVEGGFEVSFDYDDDFVYAIKTLSNRTWNAEKKVWFIGENSANEAANEVTLPYMKGKNNSAAAKCNFLKELRFKLLAA